jgi:hypothetical protein
MTNEVELLDRKLHLLINCLIKQADSRGDHDTVKVLKEIKRLV